MEITQKSATVGFPRFILLRRIPRSLLRGASFVYTGGVNGFKKFFFYVTNNEEVSRHEEGFDVAFFIVNTIALVVGTALFMFNNEPQWIAVLVIEYTWALDNMRHNRP